MTQLVRIIAILAAATSVAFGQVKFRLGADDVLGPALFTQGNVNAIITGINSTGTGTINWARITPHDDLAAFIANTSWDLGDVTFSGAIEAGAVSGTTLTVSNVTHSASMSMDGAGKLTILTSAGTVDAPLGFSISGVAVPTISSSNTLTNKTISGASNTLTVRMANDVTGTLPYGNGGTSATTQAGARINLGGSKVAASVAALGTADYQAQPGFTIDGGFGIDRNGDGTWTDDFVLMGATVYTNGKFNPKLLFSTGGGTGDLAIPHRLAISGTTYIDNTLELINTSTSNGGVSYGYSALVLFAHDDVYPGSFALGLNKTGYGEKQNRVFQFTNPPNASTTDIPRDMIWGMEQDNGSGYIDHIREWMDAADRSWFVPGWTSGATWGPAGLSVDASGNVGVRAAGHVAICTVNASTDVVTTVDSVGSAFTNGLAVNDPIRFTNNLNGALPGGISLRTTYWVKTTPSASTFTISATLGGATLNITSAGSGQHVVSRYGLTSGAELTVNGDIAATSLALSTALPISSGGTGRSSSLARVVVTEDASPQVVANTTMTLLTLPTETSDSGNNYSAGIYTAPSNGWVRVSGAINMAAAANNCQVILELRKAAGATLIARVANENVLSGFQSAAPFARLVPVTSGDAIGVYMYHTNGANLTLEALDYSSVTFEEVP